MKIYFPTPVFIASTASTNSFLADLCEKETLPELTSVYTAFQSSGRGQRGNSWESENGKNLLFSFVLYPDFIDVKRQFRLSQVTAIALQETLSQYADGITIKWPNDIYWRDKKLCGTLIENDLTGHHITRSISGTGVNLNQMEFVSDAPNPVSLAQITGREYDPREVLTEIMGRVATLYEMLRMGAEEAVHGTYIERFYRKEGFHPYSDKDGTFVARIVTVEPSGKLVLEDDRGMTRKYMFKEVAFR